MTREECEEKVLYHLKEIRKITREYTHRDCYVTMMLGKDGHINAYNDATFEDDRTYPFEVLYKEGEAE